MNSLSSSLFITAAAFVVLIALDGPFFHSSSSSNYSGLGVDAQCGCCCNCTNTGLASQQRSNNMDILDALTICPALQQLASTGNLGLALALSCEFDVVAIGHREFTLYHLQPETADGSDRLTFVVS